MTRPGRWRIFWAIGALLLVLLLIGRGAGDRSGGGSTPAATATNLPSAAGSLEPSPTSTGSSTPQPGNTAEPPGTIDTPPSAGPTTAGAPCLPTDQDAYVYHPDRLTVLAPCIRVSGTVEAVRTVEDGDLHILLALDPPYVGLLRPANEGVELGDLVVEPVCVRTVTQASAVDACAADPDPLAGPFPAVGDHVWMEGRYVLDTQHGDWAELHPLYRWWPYGSASSPGPGSTPGPTSKPSVKLPGTFYTPPGWDGHSNVDCGDFDTHAHAQDFFLGTGGALDNDPYRLDGDHDGRACERLP